MENVKSWESIKEQLIHENELIFKDYNYEELEHEFGIILNSQIIDKYLNKNETNNFNNTLEQDNNYFLPSNIKSIKKLENRKL